MESSRKGKRTTYEKLLFKRMYAEFSKKYETSLDDLFCLMELKGAMGCFQDLDPRDFGADYDIVPIPIDGTPEADYWNVRTHSNDYNKYKNRYNRPNLPEE